jgi:hypothetical protein
MEQGGLGCEAVFRLMALRVMCEYRAGMELELYGDGFYLTILSFKRKKFSYCRIVFGASRLPTAEHSLKHDMLMSGIIFFKSSRCCFLHREGLIIKRYNFGLNFVVCDKGKYYKYTVKLFW